MYYCRPISCVPLHALWAQQVLRQATSPGAKVGPKKINEACHACVKYYELFLATFLPDQQTNQSCELPECDTSKVPGPEQVHLCVCKCVCVSVCGCECGCKGSVLVMILWMCL